MDELASLTLAVRKRPAMYVGDLAEPAAVHEILWEALATAFSEFLAARATRIAVTLNEDSSVTVADDGGGFPTDVVDEAQVTQLAVVTLEERGVLTAHLPDTQLARRGKRMGIVCALSSSMVLDIARDGRHVRQCFERGERIGELEELEPTDRHGTTVTFTPDATVFPNTEMEFARIDDRLRALALMNPGLHIELRDERRLRRRHSHPEGLRGFLEEGGEVFACRGTSGTMEIDVALRWGDLSRRAEPFRSFWNDAPAEPDDRQRHALERTIVDAALPEWPARHRHGPIVAARVTRDLQAVMHVRTSEQPFWRFTRNELSPADLRDAVDAVVAKPLGAFLDARPELRADFRERVSDLTDTR